MKTDNTNIVSNESLQDAANRYSHNWDIKHTTEYIKAFKNGANWQKEQLLPLFESHAELVTHILAMKDDAYLTGHPEWNEIVKEASQIKMLTFGNK